MFCEECGAKMAEGSRFCMECGNDMSAFDVAEIATQSGGWKHESPGNCEARVGFSDFGDYPELSSYLARSRRIGKVAVFLMGAVPFLGFTAYASITGDMPMEEAIMVGAGVSAIFTLFGISFAIKEKSRQTSWTGSIVDKRSELRSETVKEYDTSRRIKVKHLLIIVKRDDRRKPEVIDFGGNEELFGYYEVGDMICHHAGTLYYEKHDKSGDDEVVCVLCGGIYDIKEDMRCKLCRLPLLK